MANNENQGQIELLCQMMGTSELELFVMTVTADAAELHEVGSQWTNNETGDCYQVIGHRALEA